MRVPHTLFPFLFCLFMLMGFLFPITVQAQKPTQTLRGTLTDQESNAPLAGAQVMVSDSGLIDGAITDANGQFRIDYVPVGRVNLKITLLGYEPVFLPQIILSSGKEKVLEISMQEKFTQLDDVVITDANGPKGVLNEMATLSAQSFSVEETRRYAASIQDPARMAQNFAGVVSAGFDMENDIVIRGNSPRYMLWRLEGIEIPNPNHFGNMGSSGGPISMLSSSTLGRSDFYTGAFPAEFGNALSGVFDLRFRKGNNEHRESALMVGVLGVEASTEGPISKKAGSSYLVNYRYSTLALMSGFLPSLEGVLPTYSDLSFHFHLPTQKAGTFSIFGLGGKNKAEEIAVKDSLQWEFNSDRQSFISKQEVGVAGVKHLILLGNNSFLRTTVAVSADNYMDRSYEWVARDDYRANVYDTTQFRNYSYRVHSLFSHKFSSRSTLRAGVLASQLSFEYLYDSKDDASGQWVRYLDMKRGTQMLQAYTQWKYRLGQSVTVLAGVHASTLTLNGTYGIDPRTAIEWQVNKQHRLSLSAGLHSKPEHVSTYFIEHSTPEGVRSTPNEDLDFTRAAHLVAGYQFAAGNQFQLKLEAYYQHLYDVPVGMDSGSTWSILNAYGIWGMMEEDNIENAGQGRNIGIDLTVEKPFSHNYYLLLTGSLYDSRFTTADGRTFNARSNGNYNVSLLGGKEFAIGKSGKNRLALNGKLVASGGSRFTPINFAASQAAGEQVVYTDRLFEDRAPAYMRADLGVSYTLNGKSVTHILMLDLQNVTNRSNIYTQYYDSETASLEYFYQNGLFPVFNYRVEF